MVLIKPASTRHRRTTAARGGPPVTVVFFHAHPDDEALLTAGTMARAAAEGHRVVLVVATAGEAGLTAGGRRGGPLAALRTAELHRAAAALGCSRVEVLGYADSGMQAEAGGSYAFARSDIAEVADRLSALLVAEQAQVLTIYDAAGGYGHPDHVQVHRVGVRAAELAGTPVVLEATVDRQALQRVLRVLSRLPGLPPGAVPARFDSAYTARRELTHRVDVRAYADAKRAALAAHASQTAGGDGSLRTLALLLRLPRPLFRLALGHEWFVERGRAAGPLLDDVFASVRP